jgi:hypothetical protein
MTKITNNNTTNNNTMNINNLGNKNGVVGIGVEDDGTDETYIVEELKKYMFNNASLDDINRQKEKYKNNKRCCVPTSLPKVQLKQKDISGSTIPLVTEDTLFWCFYIISEGFSNYEMLIHKNIVGEKKLKIERIEELRKHKDVLKTYRFTTFSNLEDKLANHKKIDISTFLSLCVLKNINVLIIKKKIYFELRMNDTDEIFIIREINGKYGYENSNKLYTNELKEDYIGVDNIDKPLKSMSYYKADELVEMCNKFGIETISSKTNKKKTKKEMYDSLFSVI